MQILASVIWFQPQYRSRHPVNCMFLLYKRSSKGLRYPQSIEFDFGNKITTWHRTHVSHTGAQILLSGCIKPGKTNVATQRSRFDHATVFFFSVFFPLVSSRSDFDKMLDSWQPSRQTYRDVPTCTCQKLVRKAKIYKWKANGEVSWSAGRARRERLRLVAYSRTLLSFSVAHLVVLFPLIFMLRLLVLLSFGGPKCDVFEPLLLYILYFAM